MDENKVAIDTSSVACGDTFFAHRRVSRFSLPLVVKTGTLPRNQLASSAIPQGHLLRHPLVPRGASLALAALR